MPDGNLSVTEPVSDDIVRSNHSGAATVSHYETDERTKSSIWERNTAENDSKKKKIQTKNLLIMATLKDPVLTSKVFRWTCLLFGIFTVGIADALGATAVLDMQILTSSGDGMSSLYFALYNVGYFLGSLLTGFLFGKVNSYLLLTLGFVLAAAGTIASPFCSSLAVLCVVRCAVGTFLGVAYCAISAEHMHIWGNKGEVLIQLISGIYAVGGVVGPLVTSPFMADKESENSTISRLDSTPHNASKVNTASFSVTNLSMTHVGNSTLPRTTEIHYAFLICSVLLFVVAIPPFIVFLLDHKPASKGTNNKLDTDHRQLPKQTKVLMVTLIFLFSLVYASAELSFDSYLTKFAVENFDEVTPQHGAYISTCFWASLATAKFSSMLTAKILTSVVLLCLHLSLMTVAFVGFLVSALYSRIDALTVFTCLMGIACSPIYPAIFSWTEADLMKVTGPITAIISMGTALGSIINPFVVGQLMDHHSKMWFCYFEAISLALTLLTFIVLFAYSKIYVDKKYGKLREATASEVLHDVSVSLAVGVDDNI